MTAPAESPRCARCKRAGTITIYSAIAETAQLLCILCFFAVSNIAGLPPEEPKFEASRLVLPPVREMPARRTHVKAKVFTPPPDTRFRMSELVTVLMLVLTLAVGAIVYSNFNPGSAASARASVLGR